MAITELLNRKRYRAYRELFASEEGKIVLADLCRAHSVFNGGFDPDPYEHAFSAGERNSVLRILTILNMTSEEVAKLDQEG